jgi:predicted membrane-bound dolichyl-phosphate-mannose-protein mannosyltransferase
MKKSAKILKKAKKWKKSTQIQKKRCSSVEKLFAEHDTARYYKVYEFNILDEKIHPRTVMKTHTRMEPYEITHPPLGKVIMALGVLIFGMNPFGFRIMGTIFGALMIPAMYLLGKKVFHKRIFAFASAFMMMFEFMHFAQTRIGTIESYATFSSSSHIFHV